MASNQLASFRGDTLQPFKPRSGFESWLLGNPESFRQTPRYSPEIQGGVNQFLNQGFQGLQNPYAGFENISNEALHRYETQGVPSLAERFTSLGGGQRSSAFTNSLSSQRQDLERSLAAMKENFGQQNRQGLLQQINLGLQNQPEFEHIARQSGALENLLGPLLGGFAQQNGGEWGNTASNIIGILGRLLPFLL